MGTSKHITNTIHETKLVYQLAKRRELPGKAWLNDVSCLINDVSCFINDVSCPSTTSVALQHAKVANASMDEAMPNLPIRSKREHWLARLRCGAP